jgi:DNA-binding response OmpR family regulator
MVKIMVIDENPCIVKMLSEDWSEKGFIVEGIHDSHNIIKAIDTSPPDLVILDLYFEREKRWDILTSIKSNYPNIPVVIFTALEEFEKDPRITLADDFVIKSFSSLDVLNNKVANLCNIQLFPHIKKSSFTNRIAVEHI